jgi:hypothetical protein
MFTINAVIHVHQEPDRTDQILDRLSGLHSQGEHMAGELARLTQEVAETKTVMQSAAVLLANLAQRIRDLSTDPEALNALANELDAEQAALAAAIEANTPAEPPTV